MIVMSSGQEKKSRAKIARYVVHSYLCDYHLPYFSMFQAPRLSGDEQANCEKDGTPLALLNLVV